MITTSFPENSNDLLWAFHFSYGSSTSPRDKIGSSKVLLTSAIVFAVLKAIFTVKEFTETAVPTI